MRKNRSLVVFLAVVLMGHAMRVSAEVSENSDVNLDSMALETVESDGEIELSTLSENVIPEESESSSDINKRKEPVSESEEETGGDVSEADDEKELAKESPEVALEEGIEAQSKEQETVIYNVSFPTSTKAFLDPGDLSGRGQIFSDRYAVENYGNTDVAILVKKLDVLYRSAEDDYELTDAEIMDSHSRVKKMNVDMVWENQNEQTEKTFHVLEGEANEQVLVLRAAEYDETGAFVKLSDGGSGVFYFTGTLNSNPNIEWEKKEIVVRLSYEVINLDKKQDGQAMVVEEGEGYNAG